MASAGLRRYALVIALLVAGLSTLPAVSLWTSLAQTAIGLACVAVLLRAVSRTDLQPRAGWWACAAGLGLNAVGISVDYVCDHFLGYTENDFPLPADGFWLMLYPGLVVGLSLFAHRRAARHDWSTILDAAIVVVGLSLLSWVFIVSASLHRSSSQLLALLVVVAYPVGDLAVLGVFLRLLLQQSPSRHGALAWIATGLALFLGSDLTWALAQRFGAEPSGWARIALQDTAVLAYASFGAAALHPDAATLAAPVAERPHDVSKTLLVSLALASLIPPLLLLYQAMSGTVTNGIAIGLSSAVLFTLVVARVTGLLRTVESQARRLEWLSRTDELTGLHNRRSWMEALQVAMQCARRWDHGLCVALLDFDHFKAYNDRHGHPAGDALLRGAAQAWQGAVRTPDVVGRYGGEEFLLIMPHTEPPGAQLLIERLRPLMPDAQTFSCGLARWDGRESLESLLQRVDLALYDAKTKGRNRTELAAEAAPAPSALVIGTQEAPAVLG